MKEQDVGFELYLMNLPIFVYEWSQVSPKKIGKKARATSKFENYCVVAVCQTRMTKSCKEKEQTRV